MKQREWRNVIDKTAWGDGPWQSEPDKLQWQNAATGLPCLALRNQVSGTLCGYVGVMGGHRVYGALFESSYQLEDGTAKAIEAREVAEAERKAAKVKDPLHRKIIVDGARLMAIGRRHGPYGFKAVERYLEVHGGVTYGGEGQPAAGRSTFERMRTIGRLKMQARAVGYPQGDAQRWLDRWEPLLNDYEAWREHVAASSLGILTEPGDWPRLRYVGFDTAHAGDVMPAMASLFDRIARRSPERKKELDDMNGLQQRLDAAMAQLPRPPQGRWTETYKTLDYVKSECADLARQLNALGPRRSWVARY